MINKNDISKKIESFLNNVVPIKYPESNHIIVTSKDLNNGNIGYEIYINPDFGYSDKLKKNPEFENELFSYVLSAANFGVSMFKNSGGHYISSIDYFWD